MEKPPICNYEGSDYQERFWEKGGRSYEDAVEAVALKRLLPPSGKMLLELGAGAGRNTLRYAGLKSNPARLFSHTAAAGSPAPGRTTGAIAISPLISTASLYRGLV
jgi:hypothetical protein